MRVCDTLSPTRHYLAGACFSLHPAPCILYPVSSFDEVPILRRVFPLSAQMGWGCTLAPETPSGFFLFFRPTKSAGWTHALGPLSGFVILSSGKIDPLGPRGLIPKVIPSCTCL